MGMTMNDRSVDRRSAPLADQTPVTLAELVEAISQQRRWVATSPISSPTTREATGPLAGDGPSVLVVGAHAGAGASLVALVVAESIARRGSELDEAVVRLVDGAPHEDSGLICASDRELGSGEGGWYRGRRGSVEIRRSINAAVSPADVFKIVCADDGPVVIDAGRPLQELLALPNLIGDNSSKSQSVLACRGTVPGVRRAERALDRLPGLSAVALLGARRLPGSVSASFGPSLCAAREAGRLISVPLDRRLETDGIDSRPLPGQIEAAGDRLLDVIWPDSKDARAHMAHRSREYA